VGPDDTLTGPESGDSILAADRSALADSALAYVSMGWWDRAWAIADSLVPEAGGMTLSNSDVVTFAGILSELGAEDRAAELLLANPVAVSSDKGIEELRRAAVGMSVPELEALERSVSSLREQQRLEGVLGAELSRAYALAGMEEDAFRVARSWRDEDIDAEDRLTVEQVIEGDIQPPLEPIRLGVILSLTGRFAQVGEDLYDGIVLALAEHETGSLNGQVIDLVVLDDESDPTRYEMLLDELEARHVAAVIGPIRSESLADAAGSRSYAGLTIVSPTASRDSGTAPNVYSLWERGRRESAIGDALGQWFPERMGLYRLGALYPADDGGRAGFRAFERAAMASGAIVVGAREYEPDSTTFEQPIQAVLESDPEGVMVLAGDPATVLQIAPQLSYFGLRSRIIGGGEAWSDPAVLRRLEPAFADYRVVAMFMDRTAEGTEWTRYVEAYEREFRRIAPDNLLPALGYDATRLVLAGMGRETLGRPGAITRSIRASDGLAGATGTIRFTDDDVPAREAIVRMLLDGRLVDVDPDALSLWAEEARAQEELMKELEEEEEKRKAERDAELQ
jgi:branched-chain amino acid transport system substrate-binding protein